MTKPTIEESEEHNPYEDRPWDGCYEKSCFRRGFKEGAKREREAILELLRDEERTFNARHEYGQPEEWADWIEEKRKSKCLQSM